MESFVVQGFVGYNTEALIINPLGLADYVKLIGKKSGMKIH